MINEPTFIQLSNYTSPVISEIKNKNFVAYGADNNYFSYLLDRYRGSPTNHAIINGVSESIVGNGLISADASKSPLDYIMLKRLFKDEDLRKWAFDLKCYGFYVQVAIMDEAMENLAAIDYTPVQNWRSGIADENGVVHEMFYSDDWTQINKKEYKPIAYPVYNESIKVAESIVVVKPYRSGSFYYPSVDYQGALQYAHIEEEIANFHLNNIMNGLSPAMLINFNNGDPGEEKRAMLEKSIQSKWGGTSNAGKFILAFNDSKEEAATIEVVDQPDLDKQYQFLSTESQSKILVGHRITSPLFFGIRDSGGGLGSNADELKNSWLLYENTVLKSYRDLMLSNITYILNQAKSRLDVTFESNTPIEFEEKQATDIPSAESGVETTDSDILQKEASYNGAQIASALQIMEAVSLGTLTEAQAKTFLVQMLQFSPEMAENLFGVNSEQLKNQLKAQLNAYIEMSNQGADLLIDLGEDIDDNEWELIDEGDVDYELEELEHFNLASTGTARPDAKSKQDKRVGEIQYKVRYSYGGDATGDREFCSKMLSANKVYRKEDILLMEKHPVNPDFAPKGKDFYSVWLYHGGKYCHHKWVRKTFMSKNKGGGVTPSNPLAPTTSTGKAERNGYRVRNDKEVATRTIDQPNRGEYKG